MENVTEQVAEQVTEQVQDSTQQQQPQGLDFIPEQYRNAGWATKYQTADDFFKGVENLNKMIGQKQIVQGLEVPGNDADDSKWDEFYSKLRPESPDKYEFDEVALPEGFDFNEEKQAFSQLAHKAGLTSRQTKELFKSYSEALGQKFAKSQEQTKLSYDEALTQAFGEKFQDGLAQAKRAAKSLGIGNKLDEAGLSANPIVLQLCAELGKLMGEDSLIEPGKDSGETLLEKAQRLQKSEGYLKNDPVVHREVAEIYKRLYPNG